MKKLNEKIELGLASVLPLIYLYSQIILKLDKGIFSLILIYIGEIILAVLLSNNKKKTFK